MSYTVGGRTYHNYSDYQRALNGQNSDQAQQRISNLQSDVSRLQSSIHTRERELDEARGDLQRQIQVNQNLQSDVGELRRVQQRLNEEQRDMERRMEDQFRGIRDEIGETQENIEELERIHNEHVAQVQQRFEDARRDMERDFQKAEQERQRLETRVNQRIKEVDQKVEADRQARLAKEADQLSRARLHLDLVEEELQKQQAECERLNLEADAKEIEMMVNQARSLAERGDTSAALANGNIAFAKTQALVNNVHRLDAKLKAHKEVAQRRVRELQEEIQDGKFKKFFPHAHERLSRVLERVESRVGTDYQKYEPFTVEQDRNESSLNDLESQIHRMKNSIPSMEDHALERKDRARKLVFAVSQVYGRPTHISERFATKDDPKSDLIVECSFGNRKINVHVGLDGTYTLDGFGHDGNETCGRMANGIARQLAEQSMVTNTEVDAANRLSARVESGQRSLADWRNLGDDLSHLERSN